MEVETAIDLDHDRLNSSINSVSAPRYKRLSKRIVHSDRESCAPEFADKSGAELVTSMEFVGPDTNIRSYRTRSRLLVGQGVVKKTVAIDDQATAVGYIAAHTRRMRDPVARQIRRPYRISEKEVDVAPSTAARKQLQK